MCLCVGVSDLFVQPPSSLLGLAYFLLYCSAFLYSV